MMGEDARSPVLVLGGTGHFGRHIVANLIARGAAVRVMSRAAGNARALLGPQPEIVQGDITDAGCVQAALGGVTAVVIAVSAMSPALVRKTRQIERDAVLDTLNQASLTGVRRAVYISVYEVQPGPAARSGMASAGAKAEVEAALRSSRLNWTVLGAAPSMQIFFAMIRGETMMVPGGGPPALPAVAAADVGALAAEAALRDDLAGRRFRMVGPDALSFREAAQRISAATGRPIRYRAIPLRLPLLVRAILRPLASFSDRALFLYQMLGFVRLLNEFPPELATDARAAHRALLDTFHYAPTTLEMEAQRWAAARRRSVMQVNEWIR